MSNTTNAPLAAYIERARKVLQHEQRTNHRDQAIKPGGLEIFVVRWADEVSTACKNAGLDLRPIHSFTEYLEGYHQQDSMQRAASLRAALAVLNELENPGNGNAQSRNTVVAPSEPSGGSAGHDTLAPQTDKSGPHGPGRDKSGPYGDKSPPKAAQNPIRLEAGMSAGHSVLTLLTADIMAVPGVGASVAARLHNLGIRTVRDLLFYFPREHRDYSKLIKIADIPFNEVTTTMGLIWETK